MSSIILDSSGTPNFQKPQDVKITAGQMAMKGRVAETITPYDSAEEAMKGYFNEIRKCIEIHKRMAVFRDHDFYVVVLIKKERVLSKITPTIRHIYTATLTCPAPFFGMNVYKYHKNLHAIEELWMMSDPDTCKHLDDNKHFIDKYERRLLEYYHKFRDGTLWRRMKEENNEHEDSPLLKKRKEY